MGRLRAALGAGAVAVVAATGLLATRPAGAAELVVNGGFESGLTGWTCAAGASAATSGARSGARALTGTPTSTTAECGQTIPVQAGASYTLTAWVKGAYVFLGASGTAAGEVSTWTPGTGGGYSQLTVRFTGGASAVRIWVHGWYGQGTYLADDVSLAGAGTPPTQPPTSSPPSPTRTPTPAPTASPTTTTPPGSGALPAHTLTGYWHNFVNGSVALRLRDVPTTYDLVAVSFAEATGTPGGVSFAVDGGLASALGGYTDANLAADVTTLHGRGQKVVLSVGGEAGRVAVSDAASASAFATSVKAAMDRFGFDGVDIDLENGLNPTYMAQALRQLRSAVGSRLVITMAPQTIDMQSTGGSYFALALSIKDILTAVQTQYYNSGTMLGCDGKVYAQGTVDFLTALACIQLENGLRPDQVALGLPASSRAAGGGAVAPSVVVAAMSCLTQGTQCGSFRPPRTYPGLRGAMTWSVNWDQVNGYAFGNTVGPAVDRLP
jgi:chitinase